MAENLSLIMDIVVMALLAVTVFYAVRLSRQLSVMRDGQGDLEKLVTELSTAVERADNAIRNMKRTAADSGDKLQNQINQARELFNELELMTEVGNSLAERLQVLAERSRKAGNLSEPVGKRLAPDKKSATGKKKGGGEDTSADDGKTRSRAERELLAAMQRAGKNGDEDADTNKNDKTGSKTGKSKK